MVDPATNYAFLITYANPISQAQRTIDAKSHDADSFMSNGIAYTLQIVGQRGMNDTTSSLILSLESVFSVISGWLILNEVLSMREGLGCVLMAAAVVLAQLPGNKR